MYYSQPHIVTNEFHIIDCLMYVINSEYDNTIGV